jgi:hypothetical protein
VGSGLLRGQSDDAGASGDAGVVRVVVVVVGEGGGALAAEGLSQGGAGGEVVGVDVGDGFEGPGDAVDGGGVGALPERVRR